MVKIQILKQRMMRLLNLKGRSSHYIQIGITIIFVILVNRSLTSVEIGNLLQSINPSALIFASLLSIAAIMVQAFRWYLISRTLTIPLSYTVALQRLLWGNLLAFVTPGHVGELFRGIDLCPSKKMIMVFSALADRLFGNVAVVLFAVPVVMIQLFWLHRSIPVYLSVAILVTTILILLIFVLLKFQIKWYNYLPSKFVSPISGFIEIVNKLDIGLITLLSIVHHALLIVQASFLIRTFVEVSFSEGIIISVLAYVCMLFLPISIANIGIREYSFTLFLSVVALPGSSIFTIPAISFGVSSILLFLNIIIPALAGLFWRIIPFLGRRRSKTDSVIDLMRLQSNNLSKEKGFN
jgi:uncharacterized membrane protein YbhN (UPF0104 family)